MSDRWEWVVPIRERHFGPPLRGDYRLERVDHGAYWDRHEDELRGHFPPEAFFDRELLAGKARRAAQERLGADRLADHWLVHAPDGALAGVFSTVQHDADTLQLYHVTMHPDHRGRGLYRELLARVLAYAGELGFSTTISEHAPSNNPVLVRHLKAGFRIVGLEVDPLFGPTVRLAFFHDPQLLKAFEYRCGLAVMDETLHAAGAGHFSLLDDQFAAARAGVLDRLHGRAPRAPGD